MITPGLGEQRDEVWCVLKVVFMVNERHAEEGIRVVRQGGPGITSADDHEVGGGTWGGEFQILLGQEGVLGTG